MAYDRDRRDHTLVDCGCETQVHQDGSGVEIFFCPLHAAAAVLLAACQSSHEALVALQDHNDGSLVSPARLELMVAIAAAEGEPPP